MFSNLSGNSTDVSLHYPRLDSELAFHDYILQCQKMIAERRPDLEQYAGIDAQQIITSNSPFESFPEPALKPRIGALLIHGLLDSPFTYRELAEQLKSSGIYSQTILLQGHGTRATDLLNVTYQEWLSLVRYSIRDLRKKVDKIVLVGFSTGAALALVDALEGDEVDALVLLAPAIKLRFGIDATLNWAQLTNLLLKKKKWILQGKENDYVKYKSITLNGAIQVAKLTDIIRERTEAQGLDLPMFMIVSNEDETISAPDAIEYFSKTTNEKSQLLIYSASAEPFADSRVEVRNSVYPELRIKNLSHPALLFSEDNMHYGHDGDYLHASRSPTKKHVDGAYNRIKVDTSELMAKYKLVKTRRRALTFNPDFPQLAKDIANFILTRLA